MNSRVCHRAIYRSLGAPSVKHRQQFRRMARMEAVNSKQDQNQIVDPANVYAQLARKIRGDNY